MPNQVYRADPGQNLPVLLQHLSLWMILERQNVQVSAHALSVANELCQLVPHQDRPERVLRFLRTRHIRYRREPFALQRKRLHEFVGMPWIHLQTE